MAPKHKRFLINLVNLWQKEASLHRSGAGAADGNERWMHIEQALIYERCADDLGAFVGFNWREQRKKG